MRWRDGEKETELKLSADI